MLKKLKKWLGNLGLRKRKRSYNLRVVEYYDFDGENQNEWCLLHRRMSGSSDDDTWFYVVGDSDLVDKELVILSKRPGWQGHWVWLDLGTREEDWTGPVSTSARKVRRKTSQTWVADVVADLVKEDWVEPSCLTRLQWHRRPMTPRVDPSASSATGNGVT
jgi:hypothetical protein